MEVVNDGQNNYRNVTQGKESLAESRTVQKQTKQKEVVELSTLWGRVSK